MEVVTKRDRFFYLAIPKEKADLIKLMDRTVKENTIELSLPV